MNIDITKLIGYINFYEKVLDSIEVESFSEESYQNMKYPNHLMIASEIELFAKQFPDTHTKYLKPLLYGFKGLLQTIHNRFSDIEFEKQVNGQIKTTMFVNPNAEDYLKRLVIVNVVQNVVYQIEHLEDLLHIKESTINSKRPKGKPTLTREQTATLFYYLREKRLIAPDAQNQHISKAIELITGYSSKQIGDILKRPETPIYQLGKDQKEVKKHDLKELKNQLNSIIERINTDLVTYKDYLR
ncbi:hypothetical protein [Draconibacterium orientale]|uniref:hypothetical protein n=1 Tax=Draconibacterium orientale TaxID=1168034 RepID=UPI0029C0382D|nr:hypothetical protein [Draconibacterium orientale]